MSAPPEANTEYSRGSAAFGRLRTGLKPAESDAPESHGLATAAVVITALLGALLIVVAQFIALYHVHSATSAAAIKTVGTGANHAWAPIPIALLAVVLAYAVWRYGNRSALIALALLGVVMLLIALLGDLPDAHATGIVGSGASQYAEGSSTPSAGLYMETAGAVLLLLSGGLGLLMLPGSGPRSEPVPQET